MLLRIQLLCCLAILITADNSIEYLSDPAAPSEARVEHSVSFETSHKQLQTANDDTFETAHKIPLQSLSHNSELELQDFGNLQGAMSLLPTKERPELNPVLSALINEDVMKSIEAKRAIEKEELDIVKAEVDAAIKKEESKLNVANDDVITEATVAVLTTTSPLKKTEFNDDNDINFGFVDQTINLDAAGSENNKKSRIEIKKGPNGQDYEYEYVYYYEDDDDESKTKSAEAADKQEQSDRGKSRYSNIERSTAATPTGNSLVNNKAKGRSSSISASNVDESNIEAERLPINTRFPSRGKNIEAQPTPALDSLENAAEKKKISVKRPSLELVDSETFNTDEKQAKGIRNGDTEAKAIAAIEHEQLGQPQMVNSKTSENKAIEPKRNNQEDNVTEKTEDDDVEQTTLSMEKAALDLYAILANENFNMEMTTDSDMDMTTTLPDTTSAEGDDTLTTILEEESTSTTTTSTTTTTEATTSTTTSTTTTPAPLFGGRRTGLSSPGRNRFKLKQGGTGATTTSTTESPATAEPSPKSTKNRFSRPPVGGRNRSAFKSTTSVPPAVDEEDVSIKEVKPVSTSFGRGRPRNRFNIRSTTTTTTEKPAEDSEELNNEAVSSTTSRSVRGRPTLGLRGRSRTTTSKTTAADSESNDSETNPEEKPTPTHSAPLKPTRFNLNRAGSNRLLPRGKLSRTTESPTSDDSTADSSHHSDVKDEDNEDAEKTDSEAKSSTPHTAGSLNRLKARSRLDNLHKTENVKPKIAASVAPRKVNPLLAKRRLHLGPSTTESAVEEDASTASEEPEPKDNAADPAVDTDSSKDELTETMETTTKQQARGLGLLGQRRRLPLRKPGTIL